MLAGLLMVLSSPAFADEPSYPENGADFNTDAPAQILERAKAFAKSNPSSPLTARAELDWFLAATATGMQADLVEVRSQLLFRSEGKFASALAYGSFRDSKEFVATLDREFTGKQVANRDFLTRYLKVWSSAPAHLRILDPKTHVDCDLSMLVASAYLQAAPPADCKARLQRWVRTNPSEHAEKRNVVSQLIHNGWPPKGLPFTEDWKGSNIGAAITTLRFEDRRRKGELEPADVREYVIDKIGAQDWSGVIESISWLPESDWTPHLQFWRGIAIAKTGDTAKAAEALEGLAASAPDEAWRAKATKLAAYLRVKTARNREIAEKLVALMDRLELKPPKAFAATVRMLPTKPLGKSVLLRAGFDSAKNYLGVSVTMNDLPLFLMVDENKTSKIFGYGNENVITFDSNPVVPKFELNMEANKISIQTKLVSWNQAGDFASDLRAARAALPLKTVEDVVKGIELLQDTALVFPAPQSDDPNRIEIFSIDLKTDELKTIVVNINETGFSASADSKEFRLENLEFGEMAKDAVFPIAWPDLPIHHAKDLDPASFLGIATKTLQKVMELMKEDEKN